METAQRQEAGFSDGANLSVHSGAQQPAEKGSTMNRGALAPGRETGPRGQLPGVPVTMSCPDSGKLKVERERALSIWISHHSEAQEAPRVNFPVPGLCLKKLQGDRCPFVS